MEDILQSPDDTSFAGITNESFSLNLDDLDEKESIDSIRSSIKEEKIYSDDDQFLTTLNEMRRQRTSTDIQIISNDQSFPAHKLVLVAVSPYFDRLLINDEPESVVMNDLNPDIMDEFLTLVYTGSVDLSKMSISEIKDLLYIGEKFQCPHFQKLILEYLTCCLTWKNFGFALEVAISAKDSRSEKKILEYISQNLNEIWKETEFLTLSESQIYSILTQNSKQIQNHDLLLKSLVAWVSNSIETRSSSIQRLLPSINPKKISKTLAYSLLQNSSVPELIDTLNQVKESDDESSTLHTGSSSDEEDTKTESIAESFNSNITQPCKSILVVGRDEANRASIMQYLINEEIWTDIEDTGLSLETKPGITYYKQHVYVIGGEDVNSCKLTECYAYDMKAKKCKRLWDLRLARSNSIVFGIDDCIYVTAGLGRFSTSGMTHMEYMENINGNGWKNAPPMHIKRNETAVVCVIDGKAYVTGGGSLKCEYFHSYYKKWNIISPIPEMQYYDKTPFIVNVNNQLCSFRYYKPTKIMMYNPECNQWISYNTRSEPPEIVINGVGIGSKIYVLDNFLRFHVLDMDNNNTWYNYVKVPRCMAHPEYLTCINGDN